MRRLARVFVPAVPPVLLVEHVRYYGPPARWRPNAMRRQRRRRRRWAARS